MKKKMGYAAIVIVLLGMMLGSIIIPKLQKEKEKEIERRENKDPRQCVERKLEIELGEGVTFVEGTAYDERYNGEWGEERVKAKFQVDEINIEELEKKLENSLTQYKIEEMSYFCNFQIEDIWLDLKEKEILKFYHKWAEGEKAKTVEIKAFIATDDTGEYYFYIFY